jgi:hypothetical protein
LCTFPKKDFSEVRIRENPVIFLELLTGFMRIMHFFGLSIFWGSGNHLKWTLFAKRGSFNDRGNQGKGGTPKREGLLRETLPAVTSRGDRMSVSLPGKIPCEGRGPVQVDDPKKSIREMSGEISYLNLQKKSKPNQSI